MMILTFPAPDPREGERLRAAIEAATGMAASVLLVGGEWNITTDAAEEDVRPVVEAHSGEPDPPTTEEANRATLVQRATAALAANDAYLAKATPTNSDVAIQVKTLTKECNALIRLALNLLDTTDGT